MVWILGIAQFCNVDTALSSVQFLFLIFTGIEVFFSERLCRC